ncbi:MAG: GtrA family protein [Lachnospiraceae bacterium]|nr:GtrA family protein [Lachnospiraceae bacterium]
MIKKCRELYKQHEEIIVYLIVGVMTTIVSWGTKFLFNLIAFGGTAYPTNVQNFILSLVNWTAGVIFAYPMNRKFVFKSKNPEIIKEAAGFVVSRLSTMVMDIVMMQIFTVAGLNLYVGTFITAVFVTIANYIFSKMLVFKKKK